MKRRMCGIKGSTLVEVMITTGLFSVLMVVLFMVFRYASEQWRLAEGRNSLQTMMRKVETFLLEDVRRTSYGYLAVPNMPDGWRPGDYSLLEQAQKAKSPKAGNAFWCLSPVDYDSTGSVYVSRSNDGQLAWDHNVLYYVTEISNDLHQQIYGYGACPPGKCPHKWLMRKEISQPLLLKPQYGGSSGCSPIPASEFITEPRSGNYAKQMMNEESSKGLKRVQCLAQNVLAFTVTLDYPSVAVVVKTFRVEEASKTGGLSSTQMADSHQYTVQYNTYIVPNN